MTDQTYGDPEYHAEYLAFMKAGAEFRIVQSEYRNRKIDDEEYLEGRAIYVAASRAFDEAEKAYDERCGGRK